MHLVIMVGILGFLTACSPEGGTSNGTIKYPLISHPPTSAIPTVRPSDNTQSGNKGLGTCALSGSFGYCLNTTELPDTKSKKVYMTIESNCSDHYVQESYYTEEDCDDGVGSELYYSRTVHWTLTNLQASLHLDGVQKLMRFLNYSREMFTTAGLSGPNRTLYKFCPSQSMSRYTADREALFDHTSCTGLSTVFAFDLMKVTQDGLYLGDENSCGTPLNVGDLRLCKQHPSHLSAVGITRWE